MGFRFLYPLLDAANDALTFLLRDEFTTADAAPLQDATADSGTVTTGTVTGGTYESTHADDGTNWEIAEVVGTPGFLLTMDFTAPVSGQPATDLFITGYYDGNPAHTVNVDAYDWVADTYDTLGQLPDAAAEDTYGFTLESSHTDSDGTIRIRIQHTSAGSVGHTLYLDWVYVRDIVRSCEPGPGSWTVRADTGNNLAISGGKFVWSGNVSTSDPLVSSSSSYVSTRTAGLFCSFVMSSDDNLVLFGFDTNPSDASPDSDAVGINVDSNIFQARDNGNAILVSDVALPSTEYKFAVVLRTAGAFYFIKGDAFTDWTLLMVTVGSTNTDMHINFGGYTSTGGYIDKVHHAQLPTPFDTDDGIATDSIASPSVSDTFTHEADFVLEFIVDSLPLSPEIRVTFRHQDSSNYWRIDIEDTGDFDLKEIDGGVTSTRASAAGVISGGERIIVVCDGETITGYYDDTAAWSYSSSLFKTEEGGTINTIPDGGAISALKTWPRTLSGTPKALLDQYTA